MATRIWAKGVQQNNKRRIVISFGEKNFAQISQLARDYDISFGATVRMLVNKALRDGN